MTKGQQLASAALEHVGVPFRLHGRETETGLDCVGLLLACLEAVGISGPTAHGYGLRNRSIDRWLALATQWELIDAQGPMMAGDVLVSRPGPMQHHIMISQSDYSVIHAHAGLRRVVREPLSDAIHIARQLRLSD